MSAWCVLCVWPLSTFRRHEVHAAAALGLRLCAPGNGSVPSAGGCLLSLLKLACYQPVLRLATFQHTYLCTWLLIASSTGGEDRTCDALDTHPHDTLLPVDTAAGAHG